jgi:hypothetical protein
MSWELEMGNGEWDETKIGFHPTPYFPVPTPHSPFPR